MLLEKFDTEVVEGQSTDMSSGYHPSDYDRYIAFVGRWSDYIKEAIEPNTPIDQPETPEKPVPVSTAVWGFFFFLILLLE